MFLTSPYIDQAWLLKKSLQWQRLPKLGDQKCIPR